MSYTTIVSTQTLADHLDNPNWMIFDCRFSLADENAGHRLYRQGHIPGAFYADLNKDLSSPVREHTGRHPLPDFRSLIQKLSHWGVDNRKQIVVYDDNCSGFAARMWWLLRSMGHQDIALLDGGLTHWLREKRPVTTILPKPATRSQFRMYLDDRQWLTASDVENGLAKGSIRLLDARSPERFKGLQEPIDPVAGHIPKALNKPFQSNLDANGLFYSASELRDQFTPLIKPFTAEQVVHMCGSGVTALGNLLAMEIAGLRGSKLYAGSWSEWITNRNRTVQTQA